MVTSFENCLREELGIDEKMRKKLRDVLLEPKV